MSTETGYLDLHTHILPEIDDGSKNEEMTKKMLKMSYEQGVRTIVATPHNYPGAKSASKEKILEVLDKVNEWAAEIDPSFKLLCGNEIYYRKSICEDILEESVLTLANGPYVMVEFNPSERFNTVYSGVKELVNNGYYPVIAHVERVADVFYDQDNIEDLISLGCYMQANTESLMGGFFSSETKRLVKYIKNGYIHFLGSDCHNLDSRAPLMKDALEKLAKKVDKDILDKLLYHNQERFLQGKYI